MIPNKTQWNGMSFPVKIGVVASYCGIIGLVFAIFTFIVGRSGNRDNEDVTAKYIMSVAVKIEKILNDMEAKEKEVARLRSELHRLEAKEGSSPEMISNLDKGLASARAQLEIRQNELAKQSDELSNYNLPPKSSNDEMTTPKLEITDYGDLTQGEDYEDRHISRIFRTKLNLSDANFLGATINNVNFALSAFVRTNFSKANISKAHLYGADFSFANFSGSHLTNVNFKKSSLRNANFADARFSGRIRIRGADLSGASGITCEILESFEGWEETIRDKSLECQ